MVAHLLLGEDVEDAITAGTAEAVLSGGGISTASGNVSFEFDITQSYPEVTLVSMLAPSPDWFIRCAKCGTF